MAFNDLSGGNLTNSVYVSGQYAGTLGGQFAVTNGLPANYAFNSVYNDNELALELIPEPSALVLAAVGLFGVALLRRRRR
ncbi:MAG: PEP-CTERM sorting domain-containing protein [Verrucomicrobiota bacterium]